MVYVGGVCGIVMLAVLVLTGCSNAQVRRTPVTPRPTPWFCEMNESREDWQCVQDAALAEHPKPARLPNDPVEPATPAQAVGATAAGVAFAVEDATTLAPLADPGAAADTGALDAETVVVDDASEVLAMPEDGYAVQLIATASRDQADAFVSAHGLAGTMTIQLARDTDFYYVVLLGTYDSFDAAQTAVEHRPASLAGIKPWIRPLLSVQNGVLEARELRAAEGS